ncbi:MAG: 1-acyl-sn-glycerol-3-phosphate acyltransferase [Gemmatimonadetes bacterium]|nr:1-acyl-sn-glycerol-3-phosphate acyltransferase [Gemmatimonadota bacterium]
MLCGGARSCRGSGGGFRAAVRQRPHAGGQRRRGGRSVFAGPGRTRAAARVRRIRSLQTDRPVIRTVWFALNVIVATALFGGLAVLSAALGIRGRIHHSYTRTWARWLLAANRTRVDVAGLEHVALERPQVIVFNHQSWFDVLAIAGQVPKRVRFIAKKELGSVPVFGPAWKAAGHIAIDRHDINAARMSLARAGQLMRADNSAIVIFPEGTRSATGTLLPFKKGGFMLALETGVELVPAAVVGSRAVLPRDSWRVRKGRITLRFAPPVDTTALREEDRDELIARVRGTVEQLLAGPYRAA